MLTTVPGLLKHFTSETLETYLLARSTRLESGCLILRGYGERRGIHQKCAGRAWGHVAAFALWNGPIVKGLSISHDCLRPDCIEPTHLQQMTHQENHLRDAQRRGPRSNCGHPRTRDDKGKLIRCAPCNAAAQRRWQDSHSFIAS